MLKAYKYRLKPTKEQRIFFEKSFGSVRFIYNWALAKRIEAYQSEGKRINAVDLCKMLTDLKKEEGMEWLKEVSNECLQQSIRNLDSAFTRFFREKKGFPKFKSKHKSRAAYKAINSVVVDLNNSRIKLPKIGWVKLSQNRRFEGDVRSVTVSKTKTDKYYVSVLVEDGKEIPSKEPITYEGTIGIDMGIKDFAVCSNGDVFQNPKYLERATDRLKIIQKRFSKSKKGGNRHERLRKQLARQYEKVTNQRTDFLHKVSTKLVRENQAIIIEDLNISGMMKNHKLARSIGSVSWATFFSMLEYKCEWYGKTLIRIGRFEPSSKMCECGYINRELKLSDRKWTCPKCGTLNDRDLLAARNIKRFGLQAQNLLTQPMAHRGLDGENPTMDDRSASSLRSSGSMKRQVIQV